MRTTFLTLVTLACATSAAAQQFDNAGWTFVDVVGAPSGGPGGRVFVGDIDADRDPDMLDFGGNLWINGLFPPGPVSVVMQQMTHVPGTTVPCVPTGFLSPSGVSFPFSDKGTFVDMDLDGDPDFVMACVGFSAGQSFFRPVVFENLFPITPFQFAGGPNFAVGPPGLGEVSLPNGGVPTCVAVADLNLDGFPDVIMASNAGILVYANQLDPITGLRVLNNVTSTVASPSISQFFARIVDIAVADFDGDGDPDLALATGLGPGLLGGAPPSCVVINPGGFGPFVRGPVFTFIPPSYGQGAIAIGDLNGTGLLDVVIGTGGAQALYLDPPAAGPATRTPLPSGYYPKDVAIADIDGDARNDIVFANFPFVPGAGRHQLLVNTGGGTFVDATGARFGTSEAGISNLFEHLEVTDFDFDADNDLVYSGSSFRLYRNRQLSVATTVATTGGGTQWTITNRLACDEGYNTGAGGGTGPISFAALFMTIEPIVYIFPGPIPVPVVSGTWISAGIFQFNPALQNGVVTTVMSIPHNPLFVGSPLYMTALMASTYSNSLRIANVTETPFPP